MSAPFIAVDWGTSNRRAWRIEAGHAVDGFADAAGAATIEAGGFPDAAATIRDRLGDLPLMMAGMVGSMNGWADAGYRPCPAALDDLAANLCRVGPREWIVPGLSIVADGHGDVMRGEETQFLGAADAGLVPADALLCQPGTHCKWAWLTDGRVAHFATAMTGELFAVLRDHALIGRAMQGPVVDGPAFRDGLVRGRRGDLTTALFGVRADSVLGLRADADAAAYVSGLLIGADVAAHVPPGETVYLLAQGTLADLYAAAIADAGGRAVPVDSTAAFLAGIVRIHDLSGVSPA